MTQGTKMDLIPAELIKRKRNGQELRDQEIRDLIESYTRGDLPDYQMSAFMMAVYFRGMSDRETLTLTKAMLHSGVVMDLSDVPGFKVDKHSTGGVGDKTSLILGPVVAACGVAVPMISGRGLGHTGGTLDKLESIPGFRTQLGLDRFRSQVRDLGICFIGQTEEICPADKKLYALRDVTATVESLPLICGSILSKKLAEGIDGLVLDVKFGSGAFMKTLDDAETLAKALMSIMKLFGKKVSSLLTDMNQPLGAYAGNALEVQECLAILRREKVSDSRRDDRFADTRELSLRLAAQMLWLAGTDPDPESAYHRAADALQSGRAYEKFAAMCRAQGGDIEKIPVAAKSLVLTAREDGYLSSFDTEALGYAAILLKAGRLLTTDPIDPVSGLEFHVRIGDEIRAGDPLITLHGNDASLFPEAEKKLQSAVGISLQKPDLPVLIRKTLH